MKQYQIRADAGAYGYFVYESDTGITWWPIALRFTRWGARRLVRRLQAREPYVETFTTAEGKAGS